MRFSIILSLIIITILLNSCTNDSINTLDDTANSYSPDKYATSTFISRDDNATCVDDSKVADTADNSTTSSGDNTPTKNQTAQNQNVQIEGSVWVSQTGTKYHTNSTCSNMKTPTEMDIADAVSRGYEPCKRCTKN